MEIRHRTQTSPCSQQSKENFKKARFCCDSAFAYTVMLTLQLIGPLIMFPGLGNRTPNRKVGKFTSRRRGQVFNFLTDMTQVTRRPRSPFSSSDSVLTMATNHGDGEGYIRSIFRCYAKLGNFLIHSRGQKRFHFKKCVWNRVRQKYFVVLGVSEKDLLVLGPWWPTRGMVDL
ncbi:hypothetical protein TNCV_380531 [Trichonephila clavipes]|nr:hypothetical protein TNCV_380531 [Trichonephila clavipes]